MLALNRSKKAWPTDVVILTYLTDKLKHKSHILIYWEILGFMSRLDHVVQIMNNTNITFLSQSLLDYFQGHSSGKICHHEHYCHLNMISAYIYTLISRGQFTKTERKMSGKHVLIIYTSAWLLLLQFFCFWTILFWSPESNKFSFQFSTLETHLHFYGFISGMI